MGCSSSKGELDQEDAKGGAVASEDVKIDLPLADKAASAVPAAAKVESQDKVAPTPAAESNETYVAGSWVMGRWEGDKYFAGSWRNGVWKTPPTVEAVVADVGSWQREMNYAVGKPFWRHTLTGETRWQEPDSH